MAFNWNYFLPEKGKMGPLTDQEKFSGAAWELQQTAGIYDYLPITAKEAPKGPQKVLAEVVDGNGDVSKKQDQLTKFEQGTNWARFNVNTEDDIKVRINIFEFPGWQVKINGQEVKQYVDDSEVWGRMWIDVPSGQHVVTAEFKDTPVRTISNLVSIVSWTLLVMYLLSKKIKK
jgi:hypothetical protein